MEENNKRIWMVRSGEGGYLIDDFLKQGIIAIGWNDIGKVDTGISYEELKTLLKNTYSDWSTGKFNQVAGQIWRFVREFKIGDIVVTYDSGAREYYAGEIKSEYLYDESMEYHHYRKIFWVDEIYDRDYLPADVKNTLGSVLTIFELDKDVWRKIVESQPGYMSEEELAVLEEASVASEEQLLKQLQDDIVSRSQEFIKDVISNLSWQDTEKLVAGLLRTMGYKTRLTSRGSDLGSDIFASPDQLGLEEPRIKIEVKKRSNEKISAPDIRSFIGGLREHNKGIYVTTSGFSKEARYEAERANFAITLIDSDWLADLIISNYEALDVETKTLVPLKKIYWPV